MTGEKVKLRVTLAIEYEANPRHYETSDPAEMAKIDQENVDNSLVDVAEALGFGAAEDITATVEAV